MVETDDDATYKIVRFFERSERSKEVIQEGLSLSEAREYCCDPETSSKTSTAFAYTNRVGHWFDGFERE